MDYAPEYEALVAVISQTLPDVDLRNITPDTELTDLGANSVDRADIIADAMDATGTHVPMVEFVGSTAVGQIAKILHDRATSGTRGPA